MIEIEKPQGGSKKEFYEKLRSQLVHLLGDERDFIANAANMAALIYHLLPDLNWAGFYIYKEGELVLGPFQGKTACIRIAIGKGVCGHAAREMKTIVVEDVHAFPGHIACDAASKSEIVVPLIQEGRLIGVLDIDSPVRGRFDEADREGLEKLVTTFMAAVEV